MSTQIGLISDIHASPAPLAEALALFERLGVEHILCAGDIAGYGDELEATLALLQASPCEAIAGNHDQWMLRDGEPSAAVAGYLRALPGHRRYRIEGKEIYMAHAAPPEQVSGGIKLLDPNGELIPERLEQWRSTLADMDCDVLIVGHTHQVYAQWLGELLLINPGSSAYNHSCAVLSLPEMQVEFFALGDKPITRVWNWGDQVERRGV